MGSAQLKSNPMDILGLPSEHEQLLESPGPAQPGSLPHSPFFRDGGSLPYLLIKSETFRRLKKRAGRAWYQRRRVKVIAAVIGVLGCFFLVDWLMLLRLQDQEIEDINFGDIGVIGNYSMSSSMGVPSSIQAERKILGKNMEQRKGVYSRMLALAAHALAEGHNKPEPKDLWQEPFFLASAWKPCSNRSNWIMSSGSNGYIMITANGGINQQRVAVCNGVAVARLLNATLVIPKFLYSSVWRDSSQFSDIYQEQYFIDYLAPDIHIVKDLPEELRSLDLEAMGSVVTDADIPKESKPKFYLKHILPILIRNRVVHFLGFGNRLAFDPIPFHIQRLRCACNFHALRFIPKIQETAAFLLQRMRRNAHPGPLDSYLVGPYAETILKDKKTRTMKNSKFLSLHLRFEIDMVAHSLCNFGGGEEERQELEAYREIHFPALVQLKQATRLPSPEALRSEGLCPLTPEEAVLMLVALGFRRKTRIFIAGANIYGGSSRLATLNSLYPNLVTKENLLSATELEPFRNFSSQLAALDFIVCTASDAFAMTDSGSQLSSLVSGYRIYYGGGKMPTIRPNKRRLAAIYAKNTTIEWRVFEQRVRKAIRQTKHVQTRPVARSVYRITINLETELNSLSSSFMKWINAQKSYLQAIYNWLEKCVLMPQKTGRRKRRAPPPQLRKLGGPPIYATCGSWLEYLNDLSTNPVVDSIKTLSVQTYRFLPRLEKNRGKNPHPPSTSQKTDDGTDSVVSMLRDDDASEDQRSGSGFDRFKSGLLRFLEELKKYSSSTVKMYVELDKSIKEAKLDQRIRSQ